MVTESCLLGPHRIVMQSYLWINSMIILFQVLSQQAKLFLSMNLQETPLKAGPPQQGLDGVDGTAKSWPPKSMKRFDICQVWC